MAELETNPCADCKKAAIKLAELTQIIEMLSAKIVEESTRLKKILDQLEEIRSLDHPQNTPIAAKIEF